jgi:hypothetical protein
MTTIRHFINGQELEMPRNWQDLEITAEWLDKKDSPALNISELEFVLETKRYIRQHIAEGLTSGVGIFEGIPYLIKIQSEDGSEIDIDCYIDLTQSAKVLGNEEVVVSLKKNKGSDWLTDKADSFSFAYLAEKGIITSSDYTKVPYVINYVPDSMQLIVLALSIYLMTKEIIETIESVAETIADVTNAATPVTGSGFGANAGGPIVTVVFGIDVGDSVWTALKLVARIAYTTAMIVAIVNVIEEVLEQLLPKKRDHLGMTYQRMFEKACEYLNLTFSTTITDLDTVHIPRKDKKGGESGESGFPTNESPIYTFGDLIRVCNLQFNADYRIIDGVFYYRRIDEFDFSTRYILPSFLNNPERLLDEYGYNTDEIVSNYNIYYAFDTQDQNTLDDTNGLTFQATTSPNQIVNPDLVNIKGLAQVAVPFSLGKRKNGLTEVEKIARTLGGIVDDLTSIFGGGTNFRNSINDRKGSLLLSSHFTSIGKLVKVSGSKLATNQREKINARRLWDQYHFINSFADYKGAHNQFLIFENVRVPMSARDAKILMSNNKATNLDGEEFEIDRMVYQPWSNSAVIDFRMKKKYTNNLKVEIS